MKKIKTILDELYDDLLFIAKLYISGPDNEIQSENIIKKIYSDFWDEKIFLTVKNRQDITIYLKSQVKEVCLSNEKIKFSLHTNKY